MAGRKPRPLEEKLAAGGTSHQSVKELRKKINALPRPQKGLPQCPEELQGRARKVWIFWCEQLAIMKLDKLPDAQMLEGACRAYQRAVETDLILDAEGLLIKNTRSVRKVSKHPAFDMNQHSWMLVKSFCSEFGFSPLSRQRLSVDRPTEDVPEDLMELLDSARESTLDQITH